MFFFILFYFLVITEKIKKEELIEPYFKNQKYRLNLTNINGSALTH